MFSDLEPSCTFWWEPTCLNIWNLFLDGQFRGSEPVQSCLVHSGTWRPKFLDHGSTVDAHVLGFLTPARVSLCCFRGLIYEHLSHTTIKKLELLSACVFWSC